MIVERQEDGTWLASGVGECNRPILAEGGTRREAMHGYTELFARQYEEAQRQTALSLHMEKNHEDYRMLAAEYRSYKGDF